MPKTEITQENKELWNAILRNDLPAAKAALEKGANVNFNGGPDQSTPLMAAAIKGHLEVVKWLLDNNADINAMNYLNETALSMAINNQQIDVVDFLFNQQALDTAGRAYGSVVLAGLKSKNKDIRNIWEDFDNSLRIITPKDGFDHALLEAVRQNDEQKVLEALKKGANINTKLHGFGVLKLAIQNAPGMAKLLLSQNPNTEIVNEAALLAAEKGLDDILQQLLDSKKVDVNARSISGHSSLLSLAILWCRADIIDTLLSDKKLDLSGENGELALGATMRGVKMESNKGQEQNFTRRTNEQKILFSKLLQRSDIRKNQRALNAALFNAAYYDPYFTKMLLDTGADANAQKFVYPIGGGVTPLMLAVGEGASAVTKLLLEQGANPKLLDEKGRTALMYGVGIEEPKDWSETIGWTEERRKSMQFLLKNDADINAKNYHGESALLIALKHGCVSAALFLLENNADTTIKWQNGDNICDYFQNNLKKIRAVTKQPQLVTELSQVLKAKYTEQTNEKGGTGGFVDKYKNTPRSGFIYVG